MAEINKINVNGTNYDIGIPGVAGEYPIICMDGTGHSGEFNDLSSQRTDAMYKVLDGIFNMQLALMRTGNSGSYKYSLVLLTQDNISNAISDPSGWWPFEE